MSRTINTATLHRAAADWRRKRGFSGKGGVVVLYAGEVAGWCDRLRDPDHWVPGCIAVDESGTAWESRGGNACDGAKRWEPIVEGVAA